MTHVRFRTASVAAAFVVLAIAPDVARADGTADAKVAFDEGTRAFEVRHYAEAAEAYERAARLSPHHAPLVNAAEAWELDGNFVRAARDCDEARALTSDPEVARQIDLRLARLSRKIATLEVADSPGFEIRIDGGRNLTPPVVVRLSPGRHALTVVDAAAAAGQAKVQDVVVAEGETRHLVLSKAVWDPSAGVGSKSAPARASSSGPPLGTWLSAGVGAAAGSAAVVFGALTLSAQSDFDAHPTSEGADRFDRNLVVTNVLAGVAGAALLCAGAIWLFSGPSRAPARSASSQDPARVP